MAPEGHARGSRGSCPPSRPRSDGPSPSQHTEIDSHPAPECTCSQASGKGTLQRQWGRDWGRARTIYCPMCQAQPTSPPSTSQPAPMSWGCLTKRQSPTSRGLHQQTFILFQSGSQKPRSPKSGRRQGYALSKALGEDTALYRPVSGGLCPHHCHLCLCPHMAVFSLYVSVCPFLSLIRTPVTGFRAHPLPG